MGENSSVARAKSLWRKCDETQSDGEEKKGGKERRDARASKWRRWRFLP